MKHILKVSGVDCDCHKKTDYECPVCEWNASICKVCGAAECELLDMPDCPGHKNWRKDE